MSFKIKDPETGEWKKISGIQKQTSLDDYYNKTETNNLLENKADKFYKDIVTSYSIDEANRTNKYLELIGNEFYSVKHDVEDYARDNATDFYFENENSHYMLRYKVRRNGEGVLYDTNNDEEITSFAGAITIPELMEIDEFNPVITNIVEPGLGSILSPWGFTIEIIKKEFVNLIDVYNKITDIDTIIDTIESHMFERDHPIGSPYFTFLKEDDPNERYPGSTWVLLDESTYLVSAGTNLVGMTPTGSNTQTLTTAQLPVHTIIQNAHTHGTYDGGAMIMVDSTTSSPAVAAGNGFSNASGTGWWVQYNKNTARYVANGTATNQSIGSGQAHNNMPNSLAIYMWRRTA